jgi:hypothetical protein
VRSLENEQREATGDLLYLRRSLGGALISSALSLPRANSVPVRQAHDDEEARSAKAGTQRLALRHPGV